MDDKEAEQEARRVELRRRHLAALEQQRRLEAERRASEREIDRANIAKRQADDRDARNQAHVATKARAGSMSLPSLAAAEPPVGPYAKFDDLRVETLRALAAKEALREMAPLNSRGKYHARYMKDAYPIAGTQFKLEKERDMILAAKKRLLLTKALDPRASAAPHTRNEGQARSNSLGREAYRKLDYLVDKFTAALQHEQRDVKVADEHRRVRHLDVVHRAGLEQFWQLMHERQLHETLMWLQTHRFRDVNVPVVLKNDARNPSLILVEPNREVGMTPLMAACQLRHVDIASAILEQGGVPYLTTANGDTAMHFLFQKWHKLELTTLRSTADAMLRANHTFQIIRMLIERNADANAKNAFGETALQHCARLGLVDCLQLLLSHGANAFMQDRVGASALSVAKANRYHDIVRILETHAIVEQTKAKEHERERCANLLKQKRGALTSSWSEEPTALLARLAVEDRRAGHLRNQYVDRKGAVLVCDNDD